MQQQYKCPKCSSPITYGAQSCNNCGQPFTWQHQPKLPPQTPQQTPQYQSEAQQVPPKPEMSMQQKTDNAPNLPKKSFMRPFKIIAWIIAGLWLIISTMAIMSTGSENLGGLSGTLSACFFFSIPAVVFWGIVYGIGLIITKRINNLETWKTVIFGLGIAFSLYEFFSLIKNIISAGYIGLKNVLLFDVSVFMLLLPLGIAYLICSLVIKRKKRVDSQ